MTLLKKARVFVGVLSSVTLLALIVTSFVFPDKTLTNRTIIILLMLISATLALDMALDKLPITIELGNQNGGE